MPSSVIAWSQYDEKTRTLLISFISGAKYIYKKVPGAVYNEFRAAASKGAYLNEKIKGNFEFEKLERDVEENMAGD